MLFLVLAYFPSSPSRSADPFHRDIDAARRLKGDARRNIDAIAAKHVPPGMPLAHAKALLIHKGFRIYGYNGRNVPEGEQWWIGTKDMGGVLVWDEVRIILESDGAVVLKSRGRIFLKGL